MNTQPMGQVIVVLGMHRSGTSALTRGLKTLGVQLGENLKHESAFDNPKGFWEDIDILNLNEKVLKFYGLNWCSLAGIDPFFWESPPAANLKLEAIELIRNKLSSYPLWGFKEPRTCRLLPFWKNVFQHLNVHDRYIIALRNPKSVADSLATRNAFKPEKSYLLWLIHTVSALYELEDKPRIIVDYDHLIKDPLSELYRISKFLNLPLVSNEHDKTLEIYIKKFLDNSLRHSNWELEDLAIDPSIIHPILRIYPLLNTAAQDIINLEDPEILTVVRDIYSNLENFKSFFSYVDNLESLNESYISKTKRQDIEATQLNAEVTQLNAKIVGYAQIHEHANQLEICLNDLQLQNKVLSDSIDAILASKSWRWTRPLRCLYDKVDWMNWHIHNIRNAHKKDGIHNIFNKTSRYIRNLFSRQSAD